MLLEEGQIDVIHITPARHFKSTDMRNGLYLIAFIGFKEAQIWETHQPRTVSSKVSYSFY